MKGLIEAINAENMKSEVPAFNVGDTVKVGDVVGMAGNGLSVNIHASIDGEVKDVTKDYIIIK